MINWRRSSRSGSGAQDAECVEVARLNVDSHVSGARAPSRSDASTSR